MTDRELSKTVENLDSSSTYPSPLRRCPVCKRLEKGSHYEHRRYWGD